MAVGSFGFGRATPDDTGDAVNALAFQIRQMMARMSRMKLVKVVAVHDGDFGQQPGTVDVLPLVNQVDGRGNPVKRGQVNGIPVWRHQAGKAAIIIRPVVGDVGYVVCEDSDITAAKATPGQQVNPGSFRSGSMSDGVYMGALFGAVPEVCIFLAQDGVFIQDKSSGGNVIATGSQTGFGGIALFTQFGSSLKFDSTGVTIGDQFGNQIQIRSGFVNVLAPVLQVNGVPVTVP